MAFTIPLNHKFACLALTRADVGHDRKDSLEIGDGFWIVFGPPLELDSVWRQWLGSLRSEFVSNCNLSILAVSPSTTLGILDAENQALERKAMSFFFALLLARIFHYEEALLMSGAMIEGRNEPLQVRSVSNVDKHYRPAGALTETVSKEDFLAARPVADGILSMHVADTEPRRLMRGFYAWGRGMQQFYGVDRLHQFVRSVEALVKPDIGSSTRQFTHRCQVFAGNSGATRTLLKELYTLRGHAEHMNPLESGLVQYPASIRLNVGMERSFQAQVLASEAYRRVFADDDLRRSFSEDGLIDGFWKRSWQDQVAQWGAPVDLQAALRQRFRTELL